MTRKPPMVACPTCGQRTAFEAANPWRPFCSERCKTIDLGGWASDAYVIGGGPGESDSGEDGGGADDGIRVPGGGASR